MSKVIIGYTIAKIVDGEKKHIKDYKLERYARKFIIKNKECFIEYKYASDGTASDGTASDGTASDGTASDGTALLVTIEDKISISTKLMNRNDDLTEVVKKCNEEKKSNLRLILEDIMTEYHTKKLTLPSLTKKVILWEMNRHYTGKSKLYEIVIEFLANKILIDTEWTEATMKYILKLIENKRVTITQLKKSSTAQINTIVKYARNDDANKLAQKRVDNMPKNTLQLSA